MTAEPWPTYREAHPDARFSAWLCERTGPDWAAATEHRFVRELADGSLDDDAFRRYLVQDYAFVETLVRVVGHAVGQAPTMGGRRRLAGFLSTLTGDEGDYFERAFDALSVPETERTAPRRTEATAAFEDLLVRGALEDGYATTLAVLVPVEWVYLTWAEAAASSGADPSPWYLREWIDLHAEPEFAEFVGWLRTELDAVGPVRSAVERERVERLFRRAVRLEVRFFDATLQGGSAAHHD